MEYVPKSDYVVLKNYKVSWKKEDLKLPPMDWTVTKVAVSSTPIIQRPEFHWCLENGSNDRFTLFNGRMNENCYFVFENAADATLFTLVWAGICNIVQI